MRTKLALRTTLALATAAVTLTLAAPAQASTGASYIGDGYPNGYNSVHCVQTILNDWVANVVGDSGARVQEDGIWGPKTKALVVRYQTVQSHSNPSVVPDGIVGRITGDIMIYSNTQPCYKYIPTMY
ncbi:peptidoglycan-binding protein [Kitasatospora sp. NPDC059827]|uniref:peptidoglycan-binding domain-containing protein n=1 Tax=Kitasatospora sp. NPDC059827 TaxID=3346964 RepID=UPI00365761FC